MMQNVYFSCLIVWEGAAAYKRRKMMSLQVGIIGTGWFSKVHGDILNNMEDVTVAAITGTSVEKAEKLAAHYVGAKSFDNVIKMLDEVKLDAVYICVPPMSHGEIELALIERGIPFLVEKPVGVDIETPERILHALQAKPVANAVGYHFRYKESIQMMKELMEGSTVGLAQGAWMGDMPGVAWWRKQELSGGQFIEQTTHIVDLLRYTAGEVTEVYASFASRVIEKKHDGVTVPDVGTVSMKLASGAIATISNTCILPSGIGKSGLSLYTDHGILDWTPERLEVEVEGMKTTYHSGGNPYESESASFIHAVRTGDTSRILSDYADAVKTQKVTYAAVQSATLGRAVQLDQL